MDAVPDPVEVTVDAEHAAVAGADPQRARTEDGVGRARRDVAGREALVGRKGHRVGQRSRPGRDPGNPLADARDVVDRRVVRRDQVTVDLDVDLAHLAAARIRPRGAADVPPEIAGRPERAAARGDHRRARAGLEGAVDRVGRGIDPLELGRLERAVRPRAADEPDAARAERDVVRGRVGLHRRDDRARLRVDVRQRPFAPVQHPRTAVARGDSSRLPADGDVGEHVTALRIDHGDGVAVDGRQGRCRLGAVVCDDDDRDVDRQHEQRRGGDGQNPARNAHRSSLGRGAAA